MLGPSLPVRSHRTRRRVCSPFSQVCGQGVEKGPYQAQRSRRRRRPHCHIQSDLGHYRFEENKLVVRS